MKLLICGDRACGKTNLALVFITRTPRSDDSFTPICTLPAKFYETDFNETDVYEVLLEETGGLEDYSNLRSHIYRDSEVVILCFAIDNPDSLENIPEKWCPEVGHFCPNVPIILVGNKKDLRDDPATLRTLERQGKSLVSFEEGKAMAEKIRAAAYLECSARTSDGVREVLGAAIRSTFSTCSATAKNQRSCGIL